MAEYDRMAEVWTTCFETNPLAGLRTLAVFAKRLIREKREAIFGFYCASCS